ncbi:MAG: TetR family transcriptional regulator [Bryobacteraceae bacterium]
MRYSEGHRAQTRVRIVQAAAREFRRLGVDATSVADIMKAEGLTHGGFYRHFKGKDALLVEAAAEALGQVSGQLLHLTAGLPRHEALARVIAFYLSEQHMANPQSGCLFAALGTELARYPKRRRGPIARALDEYRNQLQSLLPGNSVSEQRAAFDVLFPSMAGCLMAARAQVDPARSKRILEGARQFFTASFCAQTSEVSGKS